MSGENRVAMVRTLGDHPTPVRPGLAQALLILAQAKVTVMFGHESITTTAGHEAFYDECGWDIPLTVETLARQVTGQR